MPPVNKPKMTPKPKPKTSAKKTVKLSGPSPTLWRAQVMKQTGKNPVNKNLQRAADVAALVTPSGPKVVGKVAAVRAGRIVKSAAKTPKPGSAVKEATKISVRRSESTPNIHPSVRGKNQYINKITGERYDKGMKPLKKATVKDKATFGARRLKNSDVAKDIKSGTTKNLRKKFGK